MHRFSQEHDRSEPVRTRCADRAAAGGPAPSPSRIAAHRSTAMREKIRLKPAGKLRPARLARAKGVPARSVPVWPPPRQLDSSAKRQSERPGRDHSGQRSNPLPASRARARAVARLQRDGARKNENPCNPIKWRNPGTYGPRLRTQASRRTGSPAAARRRSPAPLADHGHARQKQRNQPDVGQMLLGQA